MNHRHKEEYVEHFPGSNDLRLYKDSSVTVETPHGFCLARSYYYERGYDSSILEIIKDGKKHYRYFKKYYTNKYLVTLAKQFAKEIYSEEVKKC